ncbi:MAG: mechanosensitive ion channel domain-containing protein [Gammaproteobacteria bacterium]
MEIVLSTLNDLQGWIATLDPRVIGIRLLVIGLAVAGGWVVQRYYYSVFSSHFGDDAYKGMRQLGIRIGLRLAFPLSTALFALIGRQILHPLGFETTLLDILIQLMLALAAIRMIVYALRIGIAPGPALKAWEQILSTGIWMVVALHLVGWLPTVTASMDALAINFGESRISFLMVVKLLVLSSLYVLLALWLAGVIEQRLKNSRLVNASLQVGVSKFAKFALLAVAVVLALSEVGLDLTTFAVFGGALGVGLGFGLQKIVSNFISGFILLGDRSIRPGDVITVGDTFGWVRELRARYIVVANRDGVETLIPNENLVTTDVINWSYSDRLVRLRIPVQISYHDDPEKAMEIIVAAAGKCQRVMSSPEPVCRLMEFADSGITLEARVWLTDPQEGVANIRSEINLAIWHGFKAAGITIPFPQRDVHLRHVDATAAVPD